MAGDSDSSDAQRQPVDGWLEPLDGNACGDDLEYDPSFLELDQAVAGKPETQFAAAQPPSWPEARALAEDLLGRSRDLRVALSWARAKINLEGLESLPEGLRLMHGLLERFWDGLHPGLDPDDGDAFARISVLGSIDKLDGLLGDVRQALLINDRRMGGLRTRDVEIALDRLAARPDESPPTAGQIQGMLGDMPDLAARLRTACEAGRQQVLALQRLMNDKFGIENAVDVKALKGMLEAIESLLPDPDAEGDGDEAGEAGGAEDGAPRTRRGGGGPMSIESRQDAIKAINLVCAYLERSEPTNPAQLLLRRAERLIEKNFLQLVRDLAPDAMAEVARIMGVDPDSIGRDDSGSY
nr:type VI secretion system protein TssA [uncultured Roseateles sp.]